MIPRESSQTVENRLFASPIYVVGQTRWKKMQSKLLRVLLLCIDELVELKFDLQLIPPFVKWVLSHPLLYLCKYCFILCRCFGMVNNRKWIVLSNNNTARSLFQWRHLVWGMDELVGNVP